MDFLGLFLRCNLQFKHAEVPSQPDDWSCGHRCIIHAGYVLHCLHSNGWSALPTSIPKEILSTTAFRGVCQLGPEMANPPSDPLPECLEESRAEPCFLAALLKGSTKSSRKAKRKTHGDQVEAKASKPKCSNDPDQVAGQEAHADPAESKKRKTAEKPEASQSKRTKVMAQKPNLSNKDMDQIAKDLEKDLKEKFDFSHNIQFQKLHRSRGIHMPRGHWRAFLLALHHEEAMSCEACRECRREVGMGADEEEDQQQLVAMEQEEETDKPQETRFRGRGRPKKNGGSEWPGLNQWLENTRPGVYQVVDQEKMHYLCKPCNQVLKLQRDSDTFVLSHEKRQLHKTKLALMMSGNLDQVDTAVSWQPCSGANLSTSPGLVPELKKLEQSIMTWVAGGMPLAQNGPLSSALISKWKGGISFRHVDCKGQPVVGLCGRCYALSRSKHILDDIKHWAFKLDLIQLSGYLVLGADSDVKELAETMPGRDYWDPDVHQKQLDRLLKQSSSNAIANIRNSVLSIARTKRTPSLQALIDLRLSDVKQICPTNMKPDVFATLMQRYQQAVEAGTCHKDEFMMAAQIASGSLRTEPVVEALFKSTLARLNKIANGSVQRTGSSEFFTNELSMDLLLVLGKSKESHKLLKSPILFLHIFDCFCSFAFLLNFVEPEFEGDLGANMSKHWKI